MDVHASPAELPELQAFRGAFQLCFRPPEGRKALARYTPGPLTELPNKNGDTIAQAVPGTSAQQLQEVLTNMPWDEARQEPSGVAVRTDFAVRLRNAATSRLWRTDEWLQLVPPWQWRTIR
jgi:hypothetical protein